MHFRSSKISNIEPIKIHQIFCFFTHQMSPANIAIWSPRMSEGTKVTVQVLHIIKRDTWYALVKSFSSFQPPKHANWFLPILLENRVEIRWLLPEFYAASTRFAHKCVYALLVTPKWLRGCLWFPLRGWRGASGRIFVRLDSHLFSRATVPPAMFFFFVPLQNEKAMLLQSYWRKKIAAVHIAIAGKMKMKTWVTLWWCW